MRKFLIPLVLVLVSVNLISCVPAKKVLETPDPIIKNVENKSDKNSNYIKANEWMVESFNDAESVIQFTDKEAGVVKGKYIMRKGSTMSNGFGGITTIDPYYAVITIRVKDSASRIEIDPPSGMFSQKTMGVEYGFTPEMFKASAESLISDFENQMLKKGANDDW
jgi:hypothetical protein